MKEKASKNWQHKLFGVFSAIGFLFCVGSLFIWVCQVLMWLRSDIWTEYTLKKIFPGLFSRIDSWENGFGVQKILLWVFDLELSTVALIIGLIVGLYFLYMAVDRSRRRGGPDS